MALTLPEPYTGVYNNQRTEIDPFGFGADNLLSFQTGGTPKKSPFEQYYEESQKESPGFDFSNIIPQFMMDSPGTLPLDTTGPGNKTFSVPNPTMGDAKGWASKPGLVSGAASLVEAGFAAFDPDPSQVNTSDIIGKTAGSFGKGVSTGAQIAGPAGAAIGGVLGGGLGLMEGLSQKKGGEFYLGPTKEEKEQEKEDYRKRKAHSAGRTQFAKKGLKMKGWQDEDRIYQTGSKLNGPPHEQGGINIEVEGDERILSAKDDNKLMALAGAGKFEEAGREFANIVNKHDIMPQQTVNPDARHLIPEYSPSSALEAGMDIESNMMSGLKAPKLIARNGMKISAQHGLDTAEIPEDAREMTSKEMQAFESMLSSIGKEELKIDFDFEQAAADILKQNKEFFTPHSTFVYRDQRGNEIEGTAKEAVKEKLAEAVKKSGKFTPEQEAQADKILASQLRKGMLSDIAALKRADLEMFKSPLEEGEVSEVEKPLGKVADFLKSNALDITLGIMALKGVTKDLPQYEIPGEVYEQLGNLKRLSEHPLTEEEMTQLRQKQLGAATQTLSTLGQKGISPRQMLALAPKLSGQLMAGELALETTEQALSRQYNKDYSQALDKFVALDKSLFDIQYSEALRDKQSASGLLGQSVQNIQDQIFLEKQYGEGSPYDQYQQALIDQAKESAEFSKALKQTMIARGKQSDYVAGIRALEGRIKGATESELPELQRELEELKR